MQQIITKKNNIRFLGKGTKTLLFVHGYGCDQSMWRNLVPKFEDKFKIILIDQVGSGESDSSFYDFERYSSLDSYANDIINICKEFNLSDIVLIGHSVSATICALACIQEPQLFSKLIMVCPSPRYINDEGYNGGFNRGDIDDLLESLDTNYNTWSHSVAPLIMSNLDRPELSDEWKSSFCKIDPSISKHFAKVIFLGDNRKDLQKVKTKTLVIQVKNDSLVPLAVGEYIHENITNSELVVLDTYGHCPHLSNPELTFNAIKEFLN